MFGIIYPPPVAKPYPIAQSSSSIPPQYGQTHLQLSIMLLQFGQVINSFSTDKAHPSSSHQFSWLEEIKCAPGIIPLPKSGALFNFVFFVSSAT